METPKTPQMPGAAENVKDGAARTTAGAAEAGRGAGRAAGGAAQDAAGTAAGAAGGAAAKARDTSRQAAGAAMAVPGQVAKLTKLMTLRKLLRAAPAVAVAGAAVVVGRRLLRQELHRAVDRGAGGGEEGQDRAGGADGAGG
ncbi:hypothetical protein, partial [Spirillospora sp. NPDC029432]|uniref:hypothetical protein n=1 Tax=Spirillospora sp. NPDC029432 TaxID=3154599 RepID=UPI003452D558